MLEEVRDFWDTIPVDHTKGNMAKADTTGLTVQWSIADPIIEMEAEDGSEAKEEG